MCPHDNVLFPESDLVTKADKHKDVIAHTFRVLQFIVKMYHIIRFCIKACKDLLYFFSVSCLKQMNTSPVVDL